MSNRPRLKPFVEANGRTIGRDELASAVYRTGRAPTRRRSRDLVDQVLEEIATAILQDGVVSLSGFGVFERKGKTARIGRNPLTGEAYPISARNIVRFRATGKMRAQVNQE